MARPAPLSGFPEWLPRQQIVEDRVVDTLRRTFELHGFTPLETRAVEPLDALLSKGETDKEIYLLRRLQAGADDEPAELGLHFDLTVPLARYVVENAGKLNFPFRRYQIQKVWRGERPQEGRFREFRQADIDIVGQGSLPFHYEVELPLVVADALSSLPLPGVRIRANNRKVPEGFFRAIGVAGDQGQLVLRAIDKLDKIGRAGVFAALVDGGLCTREQAEACLELAGICAEDLSFVDRVRALGASDPLLDEGLAELANVIEAGRELAPGLIVADLRIARGLDYYTGTVYETELIGHASLGSVCSGGRYDTLATYGETSYPGVGISVGVSRLLSRLFGQGQLDASRSVPTCVLVAVVAEEERGRSRQVAQRLRERGIATEVAPEAWKYGKQIRYAERRGIPFVWFPAAATGADASGPGGAGVAGEVRDIRSGIQVAADPAAWQPPKDDLYPTLLATPPAPTR